MTAFTLELTNPAGDVVFDGEATVTRFQSELSEPSVMTIEFESSWGRLSPETSDDNVNFANNPAQLNSAVELKRAGVKIFTGWVKYRDLLEAADGAQTIRLICADPIGKLQNTLTSIDGEAVFTKESPELTITQKEILQLEAIGDSLYPFMPLAEAWGAGSPWLDPSLSNTTTLGADMPAANTFTIIGVATGAGGAFTITGDQTAFFKEGMFFDVNGSDNNDDTWSVASSTFGGVNTQVFVSSDESVAGNGSGVITLNTIKASTSQSGIFPRGIIQIGSEWIQYNGYDTNALNSTYIFKNVFRAKLGSSAASHSATDTITQRISQKIHPAVAVLLEGQRADNSWEAIPTAAYTVQVEEGRFDINYDILDFPSGSTKYDHVRATYAVFDEDAVTAITLGGIIDDVLKEPKANGGPGFTAGQLDLNITDQNGNPIRLARIRVENPVVTLDFIRDLLDELGLARGTDQDAMVFWFDHSVGKGKFQTITQKTAGNQDHTFTDMVAIERDLELDDVFSAVAIRYTTGGKELVSHARMWHEATNANGGAALGSNSEKVQSIRFQDEEEPRVDGFKLTSSDPDGGAGPNNNDHTDRTVDNFDTSGWGLNFQANPGDTVDGLYAYFPGAPDTWQVEDIRVVLDARRNSEATDPYAFKLMGIEDYTISDPVANPPVLGGGDPVEISGALNVQFAEGGTEAFNKIILEANGLGRDLQAVLFRWNGCSTKQNANQRLCLVKEISVKGSKVKTQFVQLTNNPKLDSTFLYAPESFTKLRDSTFGQPRVKILDVGQATDDAAISLGRLALLQSLVLEQSRIFEIQGQGGRVIQSIPLLGDTVLCGDFRGVCMGVDYSSVGGEEIMLLRLLDYESGLV